MRMGMGLLIALCIILSGIVLVQPAESGIVGNSTSALTSHAPIRIDSDADFSGVATAGDGSAGNPWVIENLSINGTGAGYCIYVGNTTDYFEVRNCSLYNASGGNGWWDMYYPDSGLAFYNTQNGTAVNVSVTENGGSGILLYESSNNILSDNNVSANGQYGIYLNMSSFNSLANTTVSNSTDGIYLDWSNNNTVANNSVYSCNISSITLSQSVDVLLKNNTMMKRGILMHGADMTFWNTQSINMSNTMDGKPVYYRKNLVGGTVPPGAGQVILANCSGTIVENQTLANGTVSISIGYSTNITAANNSMNSASRYGIEILQSNDITIDNNTVTGTGYCGIFISGSGSILTHVNNVSDNMNGIALFNSAGNRIQNNTVSWNNDVGIYMMGGSSDVVANNTIMLNQNYGIYRWLSTGIIFHNNIINNTIQAYDNGNNQCLWDNGYPSGGNYWSDYTGPDLNYDGIGDVPYNIDNDSADNYPLMAPWTAQLAGDFEPPLALNYTPNGTDIPVSAQIQIIWNETMNWTSVNDSFSYTDDAANYTSANGTWQHDSATNISTFTPTDNFAYETQYFVTVNCTATDIIGNGLDQDGNGTGGCWPADVLEWNFTTADAAPYIISTSPMANQQNVDPASAIIVTFSEPMNESAVEDAFSYTNGTATFTTGNGTEFWNSNRTEFTFVPVPVLERNRTFTVTINGSMARDMGGRIMGANYSWPFSTWKEPPAPHVTDTYPISGAFNVPVNTHINLIFDVEMDINAVEGAFVYSDGTGAWNVSDGTVDWYSGNTLFSFQPNENLNFDSTYTVLLGTNATSVYGKTLDGNSNGIAEPVDDFVFTFTTAKEPPTITSHYPNADESNVPVILPAIYINFSKPMNTISVTNGVSIYPNTPFTPSFSPDQMNLTLLLDGELVEATQYRVTVMSTATDTGGIQIDGNGDGAGGDRFSFTFFTEGTIMLQNPVITYVYPSVNSTVPISEFFILVSFSQDMNRTSVENAFSFGNSSAQINGTISWRGSGNSIMFTPENALEYNTTYTVTIDNTAMDTHGLRMQNTTSWQYTTEAETAPASLGDILMYAAIIILLILTVMLYMANRSLRMELLKSRVMLKRAMKKSGLTEDDLKKRSKKASESEKTAEEYPETEETPAESPMPNPPEEVPEEVAPPADE